MILMAFQSFLNQCFRVWQLMKKPSRTEWMTVSKVSALGLGLVGLIGFVIAIIMGFIDI